LNPKTPIQLVDLSSQYERIKTEIDQTVLRCLKEANFIQGPQVKAFEQDLAQYLQVPYVISCANGTDALQIALMALDLKPGDEVIIPAFTYISIVEVLSLLQIKTILAEVDPQTFNLKIEGLEALITPHTKAIVPVHLYGQCVEMEPLLQLAEKYNLYIIEDTAQAIGADYIFSDGSQKKAGSIGHIGTTSFFPSKNLGCYGDGGAIFTSDEKLSMRIRKIANHGQSRKYIHQYVGVNSRLDTIQAAILEVKLKHLEEYSQSRRDAARHYDEHLLHVPGVTLPFRANYSTHVFHQYTLTFQGLSRDRFMKLLEEEGIPCRVYFPYPIHLQEAYEFLNYGKGSFPQAEFLAEHVLSLPIHTELNSEQLYHITEKVISLVQRESIYSAN